MSLQGSGAITIAQVASELGISATGLDLNNGYLRTLGVNFAGDISMSNFHGKDSARMTAVSNGLACGYFLASYGSIDNGEIPGTGLPNYVGIVQNNLLSNVELTLSGTTVAQLAFTRFYLNFNLFEPGAAVFARAGSNTTWTWAARSAGITPATFVCILG